MKIQRTIPPAAAPMNIGVVLSSIKELIKIPGAKCRFENELKEFYNVEHVSLVSSGKAALYVILKVLSEKYPNRKEVVIPALTCYSVPSVIVRAGLRVKLCDIDSKTLDYDYEQLEHILINHSDSILTVISTHLFGATADTEKLNERVKEIGLPVIEDAAQAMGFMFHGRKAGTVGDIGFFSLSRGKAFSTVEGGIILINNKEYACKIEQHVNNLSNYSIKDIVVLILYSTILSIFMNPFLFWLPKSIPFLKLGETTFNVDFCVKKMSAFQAGLSIKWQNKLKVFNQIRSENSKYWFDLLNKKIKKDIQLILYNSNSDDLTGEMFSNGFIRFPIAIHDKKLRNRIIEISEAIGAGVMPTYPDTINGIEELQSHHERKRFPNAEKMVRNIVTMPVHPLVNNNDRKKIANLFND